MGKTTIFRQRASDAWDRSILPGADRSWIDPGKQQLYIEIERDPAGREVSWVKYDDRGEPFNTRKTEYDASGKPSLVTEYFGETEAEVVRRFERSEEDGQAVERERVEYSGELEETVERRFDAEGKLLSERHFDANGDSLDAEEEEDVAQENLDMDSSDPIPGMKGPGIKGSLSGVETKVDEEKDGEGRVSVRTQYTVKNDYSFKRTEKYRYDADSDRVIEMRLERQAVIGAGDYGRKSLAVGFVQSSYDDKGRRTEILSADLEIDDYLPDSYYRIEYRD